jgi:signal transduction histidine kinase
MKKGPSIRYLVLLANAFVLLMPVFAVWFLRLWDGHLVRVTEQQLIAEGTLIAEAYSECLREIEGRPPAEVSHIVHSIEPLLPLSYEVGAPAPAATRFAKPDGGVAWNVGAVLQPTMARAAHTTLSTARVLDERGCVVASTGMDAGACLDHLDEVQQALGGRYAAATRETSLSGDTPPLNSPVRRGNVRVFSALPILSDNQVRGAVLMSRTSSSPLEAVWTLRYTVLGALVLCLAFTTAVSLFLSRRIARPVRAITASASAMARGEPARSLAPVGFVPAEVATLSAALDQMTAQLTERAAFIAEFTANVSHEMKTPIAAIRGAVELLQESWDGMSEAQRQRFLGNIDADASRMQRLVTRLLQLARIQSAPEADQAVPVRPFFQELLGRYDGQVKLAIDAATPPTIIIHPDHLEAAVHNLVDNAIRHGSGKPVEVDVGAAAGRLSVRVRDHGEGISSANRAKVFDRFFTTQRDQGGTGLGLAIVQAVAETRGGYVELEVLDDGTAFRLIL